MGHPSIENATPFAFEPLFLSDEEGRPLFVPLIKATYELTEAGLKLAAEQAPPVLAGECYGDDAETSSYRFEPECAFFKPATDVALIGSAYAPKVGANEVLVALQIGALKKGVRVVGDRVFFKVMGSVSMTKPVPFEKIPLLWERAFGGWDRSLPDPKKHTFEPRNPVGVGYRGPGTVFQEGLRCPNLEDPARPFKGWGDRPPPAGFGFVGPNWEPRSKYAGTYDAAWEKDRSPLLPKDFDRRFLNGAAPGLVADGYLRGNEPVIVSGVSPKGGYSFTLPGVPPPVVRATVRGEERKIETVLDTVILDTDAAKVFLLWRGLCALQDGPHDLTAAEVKSTAAVV